jgi:CBS domain-containing protein
MKCSEAMNKGVVVARDNDSVRKVAELMDHHHIGFVPLINHEREIVGVVTDRDLVIRAVAHGLDVFHTSVIEVATHDVLTVGPDEDVSVAEQKMKDAKRSRIVVMGGGELGKDYQGVISLHDLGSKASTATA